MRLAVDVQTISDRELLDYCTCPMLYLIRRRQGFLLARIDPGLQGLVARLEHSTLDLPGQIFAQALGLYQAAAAEPVSFMQALARAWYGLLAQAGVAGDCWSGLAAYAQVRNHEVLGPFFHGEIRSRSKARYLEPRASARYKDLMRANRLSALAEQIDRRVLPVLNYAACELEGVGPYGLADAFADSLLMGEGFPAPAPETMRIVTSYKSISLQSGVRVKFQVDLGCKLKNGWVVEVHDSHPGFVFPKKFIYRDLRVILAGEALAGLSGGEGGTLIYRHLLSGEKVICSGLRTARAAFALESALRGISHNVFPPAHLCGQDDRCRRCPADELCNHGGDILEWLLPGLEEEGARIRAGLAVEA